jgi:hypothetical protein
MLEPFYVGAFHCFCGCVAKTGGQLVEVEVVVVDYRFVKLQVARDSAVLVLFFLLGFWLFFFWHGILFLPI